LIKGGTHHCVPPFLLVFEDGCRFGFNGMEKEPELSNGNYDFGARMYDGRIGRWWSVDRVVHHHQSPYTGIDNSPIIKVDPDGSSAIIIRRGNKIIVKATIYTYGDESSPALAKEIAKSIQKMWNAGSENVVFKIKGKHLSKKRVARRAGRNKSAKNNFIRVEKLTNHGDGVSYYRFKGNSGYLGLEYKNEIGGGYNKTSAAHEFGHGLGLSHPDSDIEIHTSPEGSLPGTTHLNSEAIDLRGESVFDIMIPSGGAIVDSKYQVNPSAKVEDITPVGESDNSYSFGGTGGHPLGHDKAVLIEKGGVLNTKHTQVTKQTILNLKLDEILGDKKRASLGSPDNTLYNKRKDGS